MTTLKEIIQDLDHLPDDDELTIYAKKPWTPLSTALVAAAPSSGIGVPEEAERLGLSYFLEVFVAREFLEDWRQTNRDGLTSDCRRLVLYATNDA